MKKTLLLLFFIWSTYGFADNEKRVKAEIKKAIIFLNKAHVTAEVRTEIESGNTKLVITNVPGDLKAEDIQVRGKGDVLIEGINFRSRGLDSPFKPKEIIIMEDSAEHFKFEIDSLVQMEEILKAEEQFIYANKDIKSTEKGVKVHDLEDIADLYRERLTGLRSIILRNTIKREKLQKKYDKVKLKAYNYSKNHGEIIVTLHANTKTPIVLELDYVLNDAGWQPVYDLKASIASDKVTIIFKAKVFQNSGINWENIEFTFQFFCGRNRRSVRS